MISVRPVAFCCWGLLAFASAEGFSDSRLAEGPPTAAGKSGIQQLITQLGDNQYAVRRHAEEELIRLGPEAFDQLKAAEDAGDLEVAERAQYIIQRMRVEWIRPEDSPEVRRALARYGDLNQSEREKRIGRLSELRDYEGLPALCRIARLEPSPQVARKAALAVLGQKHPADGKLAALAACQQELSSSQRAPVAWIQLWLRELTDQRAALADWDTAIENETALLKEDSPETTQQIVYSLLKRRLDVCNGLGLVDETASALLQIADLFDDEGSFQRHSSSLRWALRWIIEHKRWDVLGQVHEQRHDEIHADPRLLYYMATAVSRSGQSDDGEKLAKTAFEMKGALGDRNFAAAELANLGSVEWAEREYRRVIDEAPVVSKDSLDARQGLAQWLNDREDYKAAADLLSQFLDAMKDDRAARQRLNQELNGNSDISVATSRREYYLACYYETEKQYDKQREALLNAIRFFEEDPDVLIAMYRCQGGDEKFHQETLARIRDMSQKVQQFCDQNPDMPSPHNEWAWLIANTEGDFAKAVEHSLRSLELRPDEPSFLDTLGRCYYAAGDLENAVKSQRRAVELAPHYQVMHRQLALFERELAAKKSGTGLKKE
jgi:tetratricopeptide (TPR) repeat protein